MKKILAILVIALFLAGCAGQTPAQKYKETTFKAKEFEQDSISTIDGLSFHEKVREEGGVQNITYELVVNYQGSELIEWNRNDLEALREKSDESARYTVRLYVLQAIQEKSQQEQDEFVDAVLAKIRSTPN